MHWSQGAKKEAASDDRILTRYGEKNMRRGIAGFAGLPTLRPPNPLTALDKA
jgi:hypothetical protein